MKNDNLNISFTVGGYAVTILKFSCEPLPHNMPMHEHSSNSYEIHYIPQGHGTLLSGGQAYDLHPHILCTTGPHVEHAQFIDTRDPLHEYCIYLKLEEEQKKADSREPSPIRAFLDYPFWYGTDSARLPVVLEQIRQELLEPRYAGSTMLEALFLQFMVCMLRNYDHTSRPDPASRSVPQTKAYILIEDSFLYEYDTITLEELARRLGLSPRQTTRVLSSHYGRNFVQMRTEARMAAAMTFLREDSLSIAEISARLGYSCPNHFHTAFKRYFGQTVARYRRSLPGRQS